MRRRRYNIEEQYLATLAEILDEGERTENRTGVDTLAIDGVMLKHDMALGFPLMTTKKMKFSNIASELEFFIKGETSKKWLQDRDNHIWDHWCSPEKVPYGNDEETKAKMFAEDDLGPVYGAQWRKFMDPRLDIEENNNGVVGAVDQLQNCVDRLKSNPDCRRNIVSAWNPLALDRMALVPCHVMFRVGVRNGKLNLSWYQRSCDFPVGVPYNIASYALLLHLLAKETGYEEGQLTGFFDDAHIYVNQVEAVDKQLDRDPGKLPRLCTYPLKSRSKNEYEDFKIFDWEHNHTIVLDYNPQSFIKMPVAV